MKVDSLKILVQLFELQAEQDAFFYGTPLLLKKMTDKLWLFKLVFLAGDFLKMNEVSLSFQEK